MLEHHWNEIVETLKQTDRIQHHRQLYMMAIKLHCTEFVELNSFDLRYFIDKCTELIEDGQFSLAEVKECLGFGLFYEEDDFFLEKIRLFLVPIVKLAYRKDKSKNNYFIYEYFLKFFSKLNSADMVT